MESAGAAKGTGVWQRHAVLVDMTVLLVMGAGRVWSFSRASRATGSLTRLAGLKYWRGLRW